MEGNSSGGFLRRSFFEAVKMTPSSHTSQHPPRSLASDRFPGVMKTPRSWNHTSTSGDDRRASDPSATWRTV